MELNQFIEKFASAFEMTESSEILASTKFKELDEWDSLVALTIIGIIKINFNIKITGAELSQLNTIEDIYNVVLSKM